MRIVRAERNIFVPLNPEKPIGSSVRLVESGLIALIPEDYHLPEESYTHVAKVKFESKAEPKSEKKKDAQG